MTFVPPDFTAQPVFALTSDVDWASEFAIGNLLDFAAARRIKPTVFVTHKSAALDRAAAAHQVERGIHPNFLPGSSHGATVDAVIAHCLELAPGARLSRSHAFVDGSHIATKIVEAGIRVDSNLCLYMQQGLVPLDHWAGIRRFPVFWEDDVHWHRGGTWDFARYREAFFLPGLKIVNVHPFIFSLNIRNDAMYRSVKQHISTLDADSATALRWAGPGPADFLADLVDSVTANGHRWHTLAELAGLAPPGRA